MADRVTAADFHRRTDLPDWRVILGRVEATFLATSFEGAAEFVRRLAATEAAGDDLDVDLRPPGRVHIRLTTHAAGALTEQNVESARTISRLAATAGLVSEPVASAAIEVAVDAFDIDAVRPFWKAVLGYVDDPSAVEGEQVIAIVDPRRIGPPFWFQQMDAPRPQRNRVHIDVSVPHDVAEERVKAAIEAGGTLVTAEYAKAFWVLADAEGNEACICTWQDRH